MQRTSRVRQLDALALDASFLTLLESAIASAFQLFPVRLLARPRRPWVVAVAVAALGLHTRACIVRGLESNGWACGQSTAVERFKPEMQLAAVLAVSSLSVLRNQVRGCCAYRCRCASLMVLALLLCDARQPTPGQRLQGLLFSQGDFACVHVC
jgi:hypothetical protein